VGYSLRRGGWTYLHEKGVHNCEPLSRGDKSNPLYVKNSPHKTARSAYAPQAISKTQILTKYVTQRKNAFLSLQQKKGAVVQTAPLKFCTFCPTGSHFPVTFNPPAIHLSFTFPYLFYVLKFVACKFGT
jgi:hypothetical protein